MIGEGDKVPALNVPLSDGTSLDLAAAGSPLLLYFYPKDDTSGCTREAQDFTELAGDFAKAGVKIVGGMTADSKDGAGGTVMFSSTQPLDSLKSFFEDKYKSGGYEQSVSSTSTTNGEQVMQLVFTHENRKRTVTIGAAKTDEGSGGSITYAEGQ